MTAQKTPLTTPPTNDKLGFYGTLKYALELSEAESAELWKCAMDHFTGEKWLPTEIAVRNFLRSPSGRHFADNLLDCLWPRATARQELPSLIARNARSIWAISAVLRQPADELFGDDPLAPEYNA